MITHFTCIIYPDYLGFDYCGIFHGNNNRDNRGIPVMNWDRVNKIAMTFFIVLSSVCLVGLREILKTMVRAACFWTVNGPLDLPNVKGYCFV
jgi:hypothetical protein